MTGNVPRYAALLASLTFCLAADPLSEVYARMDKEAQVFKGMTADLTDLVHTAIVNDDSTEYGSIKLKRAKPGDTRILLDFTRPDKKAVAVEGTEVKVYLPNANVVQVYDASSKRGALDKALLLGFGATSGELKASYDITYIGAENVAGVTADHIKLIPKPSNEARQMIQQADLWIGASGLAVQQRFATSASGDYRLATYSNMKLTGSLSDKDLKLKTRSGVQITPIGK
ncbi:MAG: outer membrane lipoprotein carrier protein LolA [Bryobacteraceae bacterium]|jgi:outer membrane lipoprotein-sorting protein